MADKEKRLRKILAKIGWKGQLKPVATFEEAHIIIVQGPHDPDKFTYFNRAGYQRELDNCEMFPEECIYYFTAPTNRRNKRQWEQRVMSNKR